MAALDDVVAVYTSLAALASAESAALQAALATGNMVTLSSVAQNITAANNAALAEITGFNPGALLPDALSGI